MLNATQPVEPLFACKQSMNLVTEAALSQVKLDQHDEAVTEFEELIAAGEAQLPSAEGVIHRWCA